MNATYNLTQSLLYTGSECTQWCAYQVSAVTSGIGHGEFILISLVLMMAYYVLNNIDEKTLTLFNVDPKDKYARIVTIKKFAFAFLDSAFIMQVAFLVVHSIKVLIA